MSTLIVAHESPLPARGGGALRILHVARQLALHLDDDVTVLALGDVPGDVDEPFVLRGVPHRPDRRQVALRALRRPYLEVWARSDALAEQVAAGRWDLVVVTSPFLFAAAARAQAPTLLDAHNVELEVAASLATTAPGALARRRWRWEARKIERLERRVAAAVSAVTAPSEHDAAVLRGFGARSAEAAGNGVDLAEVPWEAPRATSTVGYVGQYGYLPNELAAVELVQEVLPRVQEEVPAGAAVLVGRAPTPAVAALAGDAVEVTGAVDDVPAELRRLRALVVPLRAGSGTRLKLLEAFAAGVPVVSTPLGAAGLDVEPGVHLLVGETPQELAAATVRVLRDDDLAAALSTSARSLVEERYDWSVTLRPVVARAEALLASGGRP